MTAAERPWWLPEFAIPADWSEEALARFRERTQQRMKERSATTEEVRATLDRMEPW